MANILNLLCISQSSFSLGVLLASAGVRGIVLRHCNRGRCSGQSGAVRNFGLCLFLCRIRPGTQNRRVDARLSGCCFWPLCWRPCSLVFDFYFQLPAPAGYGPQFVWLDAGVYRRAQGLFYEASTLGNFCVFFLVMIAVALFRPVESRSLSRFWLLIGGVILSAALIFSYSRASLLNLAGLIVHACLCQANSAETRWRWRCS